MTTLLATEGRPGHLHPFEDVLVADRCPDDLASGGLDRGLQSAVRQDRYDEPATRQGTARQAVERQYPQDLVAVDDVSGGVDRDQSISVAVEREPDVGAAPARPPRPATQGRSRRIGR